MSEDKICQPDLFPVPAQSLVDPRKDPILQKALSAACKTLDLVMVQFLQAKTHDCSVTNVEGQDNMWCYEPYTYYNDELTDCTIKQVFEADNPLQWLDEHLMACYEETELEARGDLLREFEDFPGVYALREVFERLTPGAWDTYVCDALMNHWYFVVPVDHYLNQTVNVTMQLDTGDGNYDYSLNAACVYPQFKGLPVTLNPLASISWLVRQQGYTRGQLREAINKELYGDSKFLKSVRRELFELTSSMGALVVLLQMPLRECLRICEYIKNESPLHDKCATDRSKGTGYLVVDKAATVGLFDFCSGSGSILEIELEKDLLVPFRYIRWFAPDYCTDYGVARVYGLCASCWTPGRVLEVRPMKGRGDEYTGELKNEK